MKRLFWDRRGSLLPVCLPLLLLFFVSCVHRPDAALLASDYYNMARSFHGLGEYDRAEYYYLASLEKDRKRRDSQYNLALVYLEQGLADKALPYLERLHRADEAHLAVMNAMGVAYSLREDWEGALRWYNAVLDIFPWDRTALYNGALVQEKRGEPEAALAFLDKLWERDKSYPTAIALWEMTEERPAEERRAYLEKANTTDEEELRDLDRKKFDFYLEQDMKEEALALVQTLKTEDTEREGWYYFKEGELLLGFYRTEEGLSAIREAFRKGFHDTGALAALSSQLAPSNRDVLEELEQLYFPE